jgi:hypothetical protein
MLGSFNISPFFQMVENLQEQHPERGELIPLMTITVVNIFQCLIENIKLFSI